MKINCRIDEKEIIVDVNSTDSLSKLIKNIYLNKESSFCSCRNCDCLSCLVFIENSVSNKKNSKGFLVPSCLVPAFRANEKTIITKRYFFNSPEANDVLIATKDSRIEPCSDCAENKILIISTIVDEIIRTKKWDNLRGGNNSQIDYIVKSYLHLSPCSCLSPTQMKTLVLLTLDIRQKRLKEWEV